MTQPTEPPYRGLAQRPDGTAALSTETLARYRPTRNGMVAVTGLLVGGTIGGACVAGAMIQLPLLGVFVGFLAFLGWIRVLRRRSMGTVRAIEDSSAHINGSFVSAKEGKAQVRRDDGKLVMFSINQLCSADQQWIDLSDHHRGSFDPLT